MNAVAQSSQKTEPTIEQLNELMMQYKQTHDLKLRNELVLHYSYIAQIVAAQAYGISSNYAQVEDIVNEGIIAIIDSIEKYDFEKGSSFKTYAFKRVRGAVIDFIRKQDWFPRRVRVNARSMLEAHEQLCKELSREPTDKEIAGRLGIGLKEYEKNSCEVANSMIFSLEGIFENMMPNNEEVNLSADAYSSPEGELVKEEFIQVLKDAIDSLSERERLVITLYYYEHMKLSSISKILNVTDQRVSQISGRAVMKLRTTMLQYMKGE